MAFSRIFPISQKKVAAPYLGGAAGPAAPRLVCLWEDDYIRTKANFCRQNSTSWISCNFFLTIFWAVALSVKDWLRQQFSSRSAGSTYFQKVALHVSKKVIQGPGLYITEAIRGYIPIYGKAPISTKSWIRDPVIRPKKSSQWVCVLNFCRVTQLVNKVL